MIVPYKDKQKQNKLGVGACWIRETTVTGKPSKINLQAGQEKFR